MLANGPIWTACAYPALLNITAIIFSCRFNKSRALIFLGYSYLDSQKIDFLRIAYRFNN